MTNRRGGLHGDYAHHVHAPSAKRLIAITSALAVGWTALVHVPVPEFFGFASVFALVWLGLCALSLRSQHLAELLRPRLRDLLYGLASALLLFIGARAALWAICAIPSAHALCDASHRLFRAYGEPSLFSAVALALIIAPAEELFWRGVLLHQLRHAFSRWVSLAIMSLASALLLLSFGEPLLALAALPTSFTWGLLTQWRSSLVPALVSHAAWDVLIFVLPPPH
ncbi:MAG: CPBP family intramembrane metalloprotease [Myxococcaceae bacterium]|nr:CPBP family intramembrane metalloprotease [Myxococcaceae bacterium]